MVKAKSKPELKRSPVLDAEEFRRRVVAAYNNGTAELRLSADRDAARSLVPAGTGALRDFSYLAPETPRFITEKCVGCMDCVTQCPDTAILAKVVTESTLEEQLAQEEAPELRERVRGHFVKTAKYYDVPKKKGGEGGLFGIFIDPTKCKGCAECVDVCEPHRARA